MKKSRFLYVVTIGIIIATTFFGCSDELLQDNGFSRDINRFLSKSMLEQLEDAGMPVYSGGIPKVKLNPNSAIFRSSFKLSM